MSLGQQFHTDQVHYLRKIVVFGDTGNQVNLGRVPAGAAIIGAGAAVGTAFNSGTSDVLDIGYASDGDAFATNLNVASAGLKSADELGAASGLIASTSQEVVATYTGSGAAATTGEMVVFVEYLVDNAYA